MEERSSLEAVKTLVRSKTAWSAVLACLTAAGGWLAHSSISFSFEHGGAAKVAGVDGGGRGDAAPQPARPDKPNPGDPVTLTYQDWWDLQRADAELSTRIIVAERERVGLQVALLKALRIAEFTEAQRNAVEAAGIAARRKHAELVLASDEPTLEKKLEAANVRVLEDARVQW